MAETRKRVVYIHWNESEARERVAGTRIPGFVLEWAPLATGTKSDEWKAMRTSPPHVWLIDLTRLPSHGREVALALRSSRATFYVPIVIVGGAPEKVAALRAKLPDAIYSEWADVGGALRRAVTSPPAPILRKSDLGSDSPLPKKLGIRDGSRVLLIDAPDDFEATLGELPPNVALSSRAAGEFDVILCFATAKAELAKRFPPLEPRLASPGGLWVAWPKKASGVATDLSDGVVREYGLSRGLVDNKVCAIDATWSGLRFARRRATS